MNVYIWGDLEFADFVLKGIAAIFQTGDSAFNTAAGILLMLYLLWTFLKWAMNTEKNPYPAREFIFGIVLWMAFGGGPVSPRFDVTLISERTGHATTVGDVPLLAALPSWLATNFFRQITLVIDDYFVIPGYENLRHDQNTSNPLNALVKVAEIASTKIADPYVDRTIKDYMNNCYAPYLKLTGKTYSNNIDSLIKVRMDDNLWGSLAVDTDLLPETYIHTADSSVPSKCIAAHTHIANEVAVGSTGPVSPTSYAAKAIGIMQDSDITPMDVKMGAELVHAHLTAGANVDPYKFMVNLFVATSIKDGVQGSSMQVWADKMVFEASRKKVFEAAAEKSMFMKIYIPTITAIEMFSFFIAPVMMVLSVLGGMAFTLIGKYLMLVLFINLWGFIKVFVDLFTALSVRRAFQLASGQPTTPFEFGNYAQNIIEIEQLLGTASNLTMAIPFFAMFLLYGGVHSVMGVMRTLTKGSADGANMAPNMATSMAGGAFTMADTTTTHMVSTGGYKTTQNLGTNHTYGDASVNSGVGTMFQNARSTLDSQVQTNLTSFNQSLEGLNSTMRSNGIANQSGANQASTDGFKQTNLSQLMDTSTTGVTDTASSAAQVSSRLAAMAGINAALGKSNGEKSKPEPLPATPDTKMVQSKLMSFGLSGDLSANLAAGMTDEDRKQFARSYNTALSNTTAAMSEEGFNISHLRNELSTYQSGLTNSDAYKKSHSSAESLARARTQQNGLQDVVAQTGGLTQTNALAFPATSEYKFAQFEAWYNQLGNEGQARLAQLGLGGDAFSIASGAANGDPKKMNDGAFIAQKVLSKLHAQDDNAEQMASDSRLSSTLYRDLGNAAGSVYGTGFFEAANRAELVAQSILGIDAHKGTLNPAPTTPNAENASQVIQESPLKDQKVTDTTNPNQATANATPGTIGADGQPTNVKPTAGSFEQQLLNPEQAQTVQQQATTNDLVGVRTAFAPANEFLAGSANNIKDLASMFSGRDVRWGENAEQQSQNVASYLATSHNVQSGALAQGFQELATLSANDRNNLFAQLESADPTERYNAAAKISRMNDAAQALSTQEGAAISAKAFDQETFTRLVDNAGKFTEQLAVRDGSTPYSAGTLNAISAGRLSGAMTDDNADMSLKLLSGNLQGVRQTSGRDSTIDFGDTKSAQALSYMLNSQDSTLASSDLGQALKQALYGTTAGKEFMNTHAGQPESYRDLAKENILADTDQQARIVTPLNNQGEFVPGYNAADNAQNIQQAPGQFVRAIVNSNQTATDTTTTLLRQASDDEAPKGWIASVFGPSQESREQLRIDKAETLYTAASSPFGHADRLEQAGFTSDAEKIREGVSFLQQAAPSYGIMVSQQDLTEQADVLKAKAEVGELPSIDKLTGR